MRVRGQIACIGDSITYGYPYGVKASWVAHTSLEGVTLVNHGVNGDTVGGMLKRLDREVLSTGSSHVLILVGTNDAFGNLSRTEYSSSLGHMTRKVRLGGMTPVLGVLTPVAPASLGQIFALSQGEIRRVMGRLQEYRQEIILISEKQRIPRVDFCSAFLEKSGRLREELLTDGVHPTRQGYLAMARQAEGDLAPILYPG